ncbi:MAG: 23S rRNA (adenine(2503)-C(2))-methyltransferase RlmN [Syntrophobacterales bacterium]|jgi:23S rRNA (adenine2503-C2)-methyltransferase|nr:23S rRNA (adenine(2503)-C(2))-methyltransferase RlmN [Syntrophobacterales bacterium]
MTHPLDLKEFTLPELEQLMAAWGQPAFRARQLVKWLYKGVADFEAMTDIARPFRAELAEKARISSLTVEQVQEAADGCRKFLFALEDGNLIESVLIPEEGHHTLCLSSQVGCAQGCRFCLTAQRGLIRNLKAVEIINQILAVRRQLPDHRPLTNLVFMGMGEPLANFSALVRALTMITAPWGLKFAPRHITVSTAGLAPFIPRLGLEARANLTVSLNAADDDTRNLIMPINQRYPLAELLAACRAFPLPRHRRITFAYVLLDSINDSPDQARRLARLLRGFRAKINLIPFNRHPRLPYGPPPEARTLEFQDILREANYTAMIRESRGQEIGAACGQLAGEKAERLAD